MGRTIRCPECGELYQDLEAIEDLRENDGICVVCNAPIEVADWDRVLASYDDDDDLDDVDAMDDDALDDEDDWQGDVEIDDDFDEDDDDLDDDEDEERD